MPEWISLYLSRKLENEGTPALADISYDKHPLGGHYDPRVQEIIEGIKTLKLDLKLFGGKGYVRWWDGERLQSRKEREVSLFKLCDGDSFEFMFTIEAEDEERGYGRIHAILFTVNLASQGSFWASKRFLIGSVAQLFLEYLGYSSIFGRALWSINTTIKGNPSKDRRKDWRWRFVFCGWDRQLRPILMQGLTVMYLRMGFVPTPFAKQELASVSLFSKTEQARIKTQVGEEAWSELNKYSFEGRAGWGELQRERRARIPKDQKKLINEGIRQAEEELFKREESPFFNY